MKRIQKVSDILDAAAASGRTWRLSVAGAHEESVLTAVSRACEMGFAAATLFGDPAAIRRTADKAGVALGAAFTIVETKDDRETVAKSAEHVRGGHADVLVKGLVQTSSLIRAVLQHELGLRSTRLLSHIGVFNDPVSRRLMLITDAGINIAPNVHRKVQIVRNAVAVARVLGVEEPRVAMLAAVDTLNYPAMQATLDAALVSRIAASGVIPDAVVEGPFALDNAVSPPAAEKKTRKGKVAGCADILCCPEIETANVLYKALQIFCGVTFASVVVGASIPIAVPSRVDSADTKLMSVALACLLSQRP
jgi:phosphate butyryltransferase